MIFLNKKGENGRLAFLLYFSLARYYNYMNIKCEICRGLIYVDVTAYRGGEFDFVCPNSKCNYRNTVTLKYGKVISQI